MLYTIYCHLHVESGRRYVGLTKLTMAARWNRHVYSAMRSLKKIGRTYFANAIRKYGKDAFSHEVLEICTDLDVANTAEDGWIELYDTRNPLKGFNLMRGGGHTPHPIKNPWDRPGFHDRVSNSMKAWCADPVNRASQVIRSREVNARPEVRKKISEATTRQFSNVAVREAMSVKVRELHRDLELAKKFYSGFKRSNEKRSSKAHCKNGHEFSPENTRIDDRGWRYCKQCASHRVCKKQHEAKTSCVNGHPYEPGSFKHQKDGRQRICLKCSPSHCVKGHEFVPGVNPKPGERGCHPCRLARSRTYDARRRARRGRSTPVLTPSGRMEGTLIAFDVQED